jgi:hypothetical protein
VIENLDDGKVIHLVVRPIDAPRNPNNGTLLLLHNENNFFLLKHIEQLDEPTTPRRNNIRASTREISNHYAVITVDATLDSLEDARTVCTTATQ